MRYRDRDQQVSNVYGLFNSVKHFSCYLSFIAIFAAISIKCPCPKFYGQDPNTCIFFSMKHHEPINILEIEHIAQWL